MTQRSGAASSVVLRHGFRRTGLTVENLWVASVGIGGDLRYLDVEDITGGKRPATQAEHDVLAAALNDYFVERGQDHPVAYWRDVCGSPPNDPAGGDSG